MRFVYKDTFWTIAQDEESVVHKISTTTKGNHSYYILIIILTIMILRKAIQGYRLRQEVKADHLLHRMYEESKKYLAVLRNTIGHPLMV